MGSGSLWLHPVALGRDAGSSPLWSIRAGSELYQYLSQYPRGSHTSRDTIITEREEWAISVSIDIPRYLGRL